MATVTRKHCTRCKLTKSASLFYTHIKSKDGLQTYCIECSKAASRDYIKKKRQAADKAHLEEINTLKADDGPALEAVDHDAMGEAAARLAAKRARTKTPPPMPVEATQPLYPRPELAPLRVLVEERPLELVDFEEISINGDDVAPAARAHLAKSIRRWKGVEERPEPRKKPAPAPLPAPVRAELTPEQQALRVADDVLQDSRWFAEKLMALTERAVMAEVQVTALKTMGAAANPEVIEKQRHTIQELRLLNDQQRFELQTRDVTINGLKTQADEAVESLRIKDAILETVHGENKNLRDDLELARMEIDELKRQLDEASHAVEAAYSLQATISGGPALSLVGAAGGRN
jgi:hypothetical protein